MAPIECSGFIFYSDFDSGNCGKVELVPRNESAVVPVAKHGKEVPEIPDLEFNVWTKPDCIETEYQNGNRTWFHFGVKAHSAGMLVKLNLVDLNRQAKMYSQGMAPVFRMSPGKPAWERVRDKPTYNLEDNIFTLSFKYKTPDNCDTITYFAFTYPYSYTDLQHSLSAIECRHATEPSPSSPDDIYYVRECVCTSLENRRVDLITISSYYNITADREIRLKYLFPDDCTPRPYKFMNKKVIFVSARVHPGETPSSFVFNGLLNLLLSKDDPVAISLRKMYVFKMIPFLNPDGVAKGHYRTDTRGVNLNRVYLNPSFIFHPTIYVARSLIRYYHYGYEKEEFIDESLTPDLDFKSSGSSISTDNNMSQQVQILSLDEKQNPKKNLDLWCTKWKGTCSNCSSPLPHSGDSTDTLTSNRKSYEVELCSDCSTAQQDSGLFMYLDMHGHASKKGIFMYGNHFDDVESSIECMLFPKLMAMNNHNFHFTACNFTERNMYLKDRRDGMSREGSGRVAVLKTTGLVRSYTLECNYNTGRLVNILPPTVKEGNNRIMHTLSVPPRYTPQVYEEVGKALGASILDLTGSNPSTRIPNSEFHSLSGLREWLRVNCLAEMGLSRVVARPKASNAQNKAIRCKSLKPGMKHRPVNGKMIAKRPGSKVRLAGPVPVARKENLIYPEKEQTVAPAPVCLHSAPAIVRSFSRLPNRPKGLTLRPRSKRDGSLRCKSSTQTQEAPNPTRSLAKTSIIQNRIKSESHSSQMKIESPKRLKVSKGFRDITTDRIQLKEICFIKQKTSKKVITKFMNTETQQMDGHDDNEDLVVAWDKSGAARVMTVQAENPQEGRILSTFKNAEPSTSSKLASRSSIKNGSFISNKIKRSKCSLRRLASANIETTGMVDKLKKRKKLQSKIV